MHILNLTVCSMHTMITGNTMMELRASVRCECVCRNPQSVCNASSCLKVTPYLASPVENLKLYIAYTERRPGSSTSYGEVVYNKIYLRNIYNIYLYLYYFKVRSVFDK